MPVKQDIMADHRLTLALLPGFFAICRLQPQEPIPPWAEPDGFLSLTRTADELSIVCRQECVPQEIHCARDRRCFRVVGTLDLALVGVLRSLLAPLSDAGISVFTLSTFDTDYLLVRDEDLGNAIEELRNAGHTVQRPLEG
jgi:hypothetical protein